MISIESAPWWFWVFLILLIPLLFIIKHVFGTIFKEKEISIENSSNVNINSGVQIINKNISDNNPLDDDCRLILSKANESNQTTYAECGMSLERFKKAARQLREKGYVNNGPNDGAVIITDEGRDVL